MNEQPAADDRSRARHSVRTRLNHIVGYGDILRQDAEEAGREGLEDLFNRIRDSALSLRAPLDSRFASAGAPAGSDLGGLEQDIYAILFQLIALIQESKQRAQEYDDFSLSRDIDKMLEAANGVLELLEVERAGAAEPDALPRVAPAPSTEATEDGPPSRTGRILVVDDNLFNRELLARHLERQGHVVCTAADGLAALELLNAENFDIMILDVMMPGMNGYQTLERVRADERFSDLYIIVISALSDTHSIARCIQLGAEDYLPREFEPVILKARIESCLEKKSLKEEQALYVSALVETQERLRAELRGGASYVRSLLPPRISAPALRSDWMFIPSASLGGDVFGYHRIRRTEEEDAARELSAETLAAPGARLAIYLIDVSGHGIESALFSVTLMNLLKTQVLTGTDFADPASVLARLAASFRMEEQNYLYFTAWYGVWEPAARTITYASAGSPPAIMISRDGQGAELETGGMMVGLDPKTLYSNQTKEISPGCRLYLFSDGVYEFRDKSDRIFGLEPFTELLRDRVRATDFSKSALDGILHDVQSRAAKTRFLDDVSLMEFAFG